MSDSYIRNWKLLQLIPRFPRKADAKQLYDAMREEGYKVTKRTIERDLIMLSQAFSIYCDNRSRPYGWCWMKDSYVNIPGMDLQMALTFGMVRHFMPQLMPKSSLKYLNSYFLLADKTLKNAEHSGMGSWIDKVRVLGRGMQLQTPEVREEVMDAVYEALLNSQRLFVKYKPRDAEVPKEYEINPLGVVIRNSVIYIVCCIKDYDQVMQLVMHRMHEAVVVDKERRMPDGFNLDDYIKSGEFSVPVEETPIRLKALFDAPAAFHLHETPLSDDQTIETQPDGRLLVSATVRNSQELRWWLLAFGDQVEVVEPVRLRQTMSDILQKASNQYK